MTARAVLLKTHLYLGLTAAVFLIVLSLTGAVMAFEHDIDHWLHPHLWFVSPGRRVLPERELIHAAERRFPPARVSVVQIQEAANLAYLMLLTDRTAVYIDPYNAAILGRTAGISRTEKMIGYIHQLHLRLVPDPRSSPPTASMIGKLVVSTAGLLLCCLVPTGLVLWWRTKQSSVHWNASWFRVFFDLHHAIGAYSALFLFVAAFTGVMVGFDFAENLIYKFTHSAPPPRMVTAQSTVVAGAAPIGLDTALASARGAVPGGALAIIRLPSNPKDVFVIQMRSPEDVSVFSPVLVTVLLDQYTGKALAIRNPLASPGYRKVRLNRAIHTGDIGGAAGHVVVSLSSLLLGVMVVTGLVIWMKRLAV